MSISNVHIWKKWKSSHVATVEKSLAESSACLVMKKLVHQNLKDYNLNKTSLRFEVFSLERLWTLVEDSVPPSTRDRVKGGGSKLCVLVPWTIGSLHTKSWPPTMPRTLQKVLGGVGGWVVLTPNLVFCFGPKLWFWPGPSWTKTVDLFEPYKL